MMRNVNVNEPQNKQSCQTSVSKSAIIENFIPYFKQNETEEFSFENNEWVKCDRKKINLLWEDWICDVRAESYTDENGFLVFGYDTKERQITICYKFSEGIDVLKEKLTIGKEYLFSDMLQEEKSFEVKWRKGTLNKIERHPNSANCLLSGSQYFLYARELDS